MRATLLAGALFFFASNALADTASSARAETLFREGKALMAEDNFEAACPKLAESQKIDPGSGTLLALAICDERRGHAASSFAEFSELVELAGKEGHKDRQEIARSRLVVLAPAVAHISLTIPQEDLAMTDLTMTLDGAKVARSAWKEAQSVDPGDHRIALSASGHVGWSTQVTIAGADQRELDAPILQPIEQRSGPQRTLGLVGMGVGAATMLTGAVFGVIALADHGHAASQCAGGPAEGCTNLAAVNLNDTARTFATVSSVTVIAGLGIGLISVSIYFTAPKTAAAATTARHPVQLTFGANRVGLVGSFD